MSTTETRVGSPYRRLLGYLGPYRWMFLASLALGVGAAGMEAFSLLLLIPFLRSLFGMGPLLPEGGRNAAERLIDGVAGGWIGGAEGLDGLRIVCLLVLAALVLKNACLYGGRVLSIRTQEFVVRDVRDAVHAHLQRLPLAYFERQKVGQLIARVVSDTDQSKPVVTDALAQAVRQVAMLVAYAAALLALSWRLTLLAVVLIPLVTLGLRPLLKRLRGRFRRAYEDQGELVAAVQESLSGIRLVKAFGAESFEDDRFRARSEAFRRERTSAAASQHLASPLSEVLASGVAVGLVWIGASQVLNNGTLGPEQFLAFVTIALRAISPVKRLVQYPTVVAQGLAASDRFFEVLDEVPEPLGGDRTATDLSDAIVYEDVRFEYEPGQPVLESVDLTIPCGSVVALVGPSGSGKSTLIDLLPRFADPQGGRVSIDGTDVRDFSVASLRDLIGLVSQETALLNDSVRANIAYGDTTARDEDIERAARAAHADGFIRELPEGYDTVLGDRGVRLSGGQRQRIGIARAILRDPPILILDEATSALDAESELAVRDALAELFEGRTVVVVAHRLSTVREADAIFVLEQGRIVGSGRHDTLIQQNGPYQRLFARQLEPESVTSA